MGMGQVFLPGTPPRGHRPGQGMGPEAFRDTFLPLRAGTGISDPEMGRELCRCGTWVFLEFPQVTTWVSAILGQLQTE